MAFDAITGSGFLLKPGGAMEEGLPTDLRPNEYTHSSGITNTGRLIRTPGKRFVQQFADRVLQIVGFGGAVIIQHGSTIIMFPDACAVSPTDDDDANHVIVNMVPHDPLNETTSHNVSPVPWPQHPSIVRSAPYGVYPPGAYPPPFYGDISPSGYTQSNGTGTHFYKHIYLEGYTGAIRDASQWDFSAELTTAQAEGYLDLRAYDPTRYTKAELIGTLETFNKDGSTNITPVTGYLFDVTSHLGKKDYIGLPYPYSTPWQTYILNDAENTAEYKFVVEITALRLTKRGKPDS